jgi:predicted amidophosphoribosyltransferase
VLPVELSSAREVRRNGVIVKLIVDKISAWGGSDKRTYARETENSPQLETVARERLVKTQQAGKRLAGIVVICKV